MTHSEIYKKFFIEYDKDMITSSYPSLTLTEVCNFLNKAYLALIALKFTGNNLRQIPFEGDTKQLEDLEPLIKITTLNSNLVSFYALNQIDFNIPDDMLYYVSSMLQHYIIDTQHGELLSDNFYEVDLIQHQYENNFIYTKHNLPWIENPVCTINDKKINIFYDYYDFKINDETNKESRLRLFLKYIKKPEFFNGELSKDTEFELSDSVAEELINLAITFVLDNVESSRISTKTNLLKLES